MTPRPSIQLKKNRDALIAAHGKMSATAYLKENARLIDEYFLESFARSQVGPTLSRAGATCAMVALGGYGRDEQCVHSDVDILILFDRKVPREAEDLVREIIYPLWDIGLDVGHATRSIDDCIKMAGSDLEVFTSLLTARFLCGLSPLFSRLTSAINDRLIQSSRGKILKWLKAGSEERHRNFGDSTNLIEPHLKNGMGGLRDYHVMLWLGRIRSMVKQPEDFLTQGYMNANEYAGLMDSLEFIWDVRNRLHIITGRKCDQLHFEHQATIAKSFKFRKMDGQQPVERFMGVLHAKMEFIKQHHLMFLAEMGQNRTAVLSRDLFKRSRIPGLAISKHMLHFVSDRDIVDNPLLLLDIFSESARLKLPLSSSAKRKVTEHWDLIETFRYDKAVTKSFERIMAGVSPEFNVLNDMLSTGFLVRLIPEFDKIANRIQYNQYHIYPVDRHSIHVLQAVIHFSSRESMATEPFHAKLYGELISKKALHWAALFHDIGKGVPGGEHSRVGAKIVRDVLGKRAVNPRVIDAVAFLIERHLYLINVAKRRDIDDEETVMACARTIKDADRLKMLYLLTVADSVSTGPNAWNTWTASLLRDLFFKVLEILESGDQVSHRKEKTIQHKKEKILAADHAFRLDPGALGDLIESMPPRYLLSTPEKRIIEHIDLYESRQDAPFALKVRKLPQSSNRCAAICATDKPGFFSKVAGVFTLNDFDILDAQIYSWGKQTALDLFTIKPFYDLSRESERWDRVRDDLSRVLSGSLDLEEALRNKTAGPFRKHPVVMSGQANRVDIDNKSSSFSTIIEVYSYDFPGLLYAVTNALYQCSLDIVYAKIATHVEQVVDIFYVRDLLGAKVDQPDRIREIRKAVLTAIGQSRRPAASPTVIEF
ncbi:[protein-PII] uridylyltransferase [Desulfatiferula olefinivorans]